MPEKTDPRRVELSGGKVAELDPYAVTWDEVLKVTSGTKKNSDEYMAILAKVSGIDAKELRKLPYPDASKLDDAVWNLLRDPLGADPN